MSAARVAARSKPVIVLKAGRHCQGAKVAATHTGALAGSDAVYDAAFRRAGLLRVLDLDELFDTTETLGRLKPFPALALQNDWETQAAGDRTGCRSTWLTPCKDGGNASGETRKGCGPAAAECAPHLLVDDRSPAIASTTALVRPVACEGSGR
jgi:hypothetical protein